MESGARRPEGRERISAVAEGVTPSEVSIRAIDEAASQLAPDDPALAEWYHEYHQTHRARLAFDLDHLEARVAPSSAILDVGSVPLLLTGALKARGYGVCGVDVHPDRFASSIGRLGLDIRKCDVERQRLPFVDASLDVVVFNEIFEHLRVNPIFTLDEIFRVLRPGGTLMLSTPNLRSLRGLFNFLVRGRAAACCTDLFDEYSKLDTLGHMGHVREYTTREVLDFLGRIGFKRHEVIYRGGGERPGITVRLFPRLRPFFSVVTTKPVDAPGPTALARTDSPKPAPGSPISRDS